MVRQNLNNPRKTPDNNCFFSSNIKAECSKPEGNHVCMSGVVYMLQHLKWQILDSLVMMCKIENEKGAITKEKDKATLETDRPPLRQTGHP
jgi:hypothetical protein